MAYFSSCYFFITRFSSLRLILGHCYSLWVNLGYFSTVSSKEFLDIKAFRECRSTLKCVSDMIITYS